MFRKRGECKHLKNPENSSMDSFQGVGEAAYSKKSVTGALEENYTLPIPITDNNFKILRNNQSLLCEVLQNKFDCISTLVSPAREGNKSLPVFRKMLIPGLELSVWKDDLTRHSVDMVVNAANEDLMHGGGLAHALVKAGGFEIQEESSEFVNKHGKIATGEVAVTKAGRLPCKFIIHAVGPRWDEKDEKRCVFLLQNAITNVLKHATCERTVAIPAVSSGIFQFPLHLCTETIVKTIKLYFQQKQLDTCLKEVHLVSNEEPTVAAFKAASEVILGYNELEPWVEQEAMTLNTMVVNNLTLQVVQGCIEHQKTNVIVNSASPKGDLKQGYLSPLILKQAGKEMEKELSNTMTKIVQDSQLVLVTEGFKLPCQYVYHVLWNSKYDSREKMLMNAMEMCLSKCLELNVTSISFPALGTGSVGIWKTTVAQIMFNEVLKFAQKCGKKLTVKFVIIPEQLELYTIFSIEMAKNKSKLQNFNNHSVFSVSWLTRERKENECEATSPAINLMGSNQEKMDEAAWWINRLLNHQGRHVIENNVIFYLGKKEHDTIAQLQRNSGISISENINMGKAELVIKGIQADIIETVMSIEHLLCNIQEDLVRNRERSLWSLSGQWTDQQQRDQDEMKENKFLKCLKLDSKEIQHQKKQFENCGFRVIKVEKIDNVALKDAFQRNKMMMKKRICEQPVSHKLFQQVPHQFCKVVARVGFQRMCSVPCDYRFGVGMYFTKNLKNLFFQVKETPTTDKRIYVFEAEVLTGCFCNGHKSNIVPPPLKPGAIESYDSVVDNVSDPEIFVIFNDMQAMPQYLWTCYQDHVPSQDMMLSPQQSWKRFSGSSVD